MRKLLLVALFSVAGVGLTTRPASAWLLGGCCNHCCSGSATLCIKPYNAFSPSCFGTIACDGCFPVNFGNHGPYPPGWNCTGCGPAGPPVGAVMDGSCGSCYAGAPGLGLPPGAQIVTAPTTLPPVQGVPTIQTPPAQGAPVLQAPPQGVPTIQTPPAPMPAGPNTGAMARPFPVQPTGYYPPYAAQGYNPYYAPMPWMQPTNYPAYWGQQGYGGR